jgi:hypothetical protein
MAAAASRHVAFIVSVSGSGVSAAEQEVFSVEAQSRAAGFPRSTSPRPACSPACGSTGN